MRIRTIFLEGVGPIRNRTIDLRDTWKGGVHPLVLFSGPNGCGKSTILRGIAHLWQLLGQWLTTPAILTFDKPIFLSSETASGARAKGPMASRRWLEKCNALCMVMDDVHGLSEPLGVFYGEKKSLDTLRASAHDVRLWIGEVVERTGRRGRPPRHRIDQDEKPYSKLTEACRKLILGSEPNGMPNLIYLDGEERKWVRPTTGTGQVVPDDPAMRWLVTYRPTTDWSGQLEASLIALKTINPEQYYQVVRDLNGFFLGKEILLEPDAKSLRLRVKVGQEAEHGLDDLSAGEHQVMIQLYLASRFMQPGGLILIDEPDLHLHPALIGPFLAKLEELVQQRNGQLFLTSHLPAIWQRYEARGHREQLGGEQ